MDVITKTHRVDFEVITLTGRLDALEATSLRTLLTARLDEGINNLIVDLQGVDFVDSAGLAALVNAMKGARTAGGDVRLVRSNHPDAVRVFELTRFDQVFVMADSADELVGNW